MIAPGGSFNRAVPLAESDLLRALPVAMLVFDAAGYLAELSDAATSLFGRQRETLLGSRMDELFETPEILLDRESSCEVRLIAGPGRPLSARIGPLPPPGGSVVILGCLDDFGSEQHHKALRSVNLATIGELATGVAHEINNPINGIINYGQMLHDRLKTADAASADLAERIMREGRRISKIVRNLLGLARHDDKSRIATTLAGELEAVLTLTRAQLRREGVALSVDVDPDPPPVLANPYQVQQILHNLIQNARYALVQKAAMAGSGKELQISLHPQRDSGGNYLRITVTDNGVGIPAKLLGRVSEPFFTTKPVGAGTGLGLSICREILSDHGGRLSIESEEGVFTRVHVDLPTSGEV